MKQLTAIDKMSSMQIAEVTGKRHDNIMRDIKDEIEKLEKGGIDGALKFEVTSYTTDQNKEMPCYQLSKEGVLQLAARYDAVIRAKLIDLAMKQDNPYAGLSPELKAIFVTDRKVQEIDTRVDKLENTMTIDYTQQEVIRELANITVIRELGGKSSPAYKIVGNKAFAEQWRNYKRVMQVNSYRNTPTVDFERAKEVVQGWKPDTELSLMIMGANLGQAVSA